MTKGGRPRVPTAPPAPASSSSCAPAARDGCCLSSWAAAAGRRVGASCATGRRPGSGNACTSDCSTGWARRPPSTGRGPAWTASACWPRAGRADRAEPRRPRQRPEGARHQVPPGRGRQGNSPCRPPLGRRSARCDPVAPAGRRHRPAGARRSSVPVVGRAGPGRTRPSRTSTRRTPRRTRGAPGAPAASPRGSPGASAPWAIEASERLGRHRRVVERTQARLLGVRRLGVRDERRAALLRGPRHRARALLCLRFLGPGDA